MGKTGRVPFYYRIWEAAKILNMPFDVLAGHRNRVELMDIAFTCEYGSKQGEMELKTNPLYKNLVKQFQKDSEIK